jgi:AcrR family transcriptional regulator
MAAPAEVDERRALIDAGLSVLRRHGRDGCTVADVLAEANLSTRAFYRHFGSKDELVLAIYEHDARATRSRLRERMTAAGDSRAALHVWIDETLALGFDTQRARRTRPLANEGLRLQAVFPTQFATIVEGVLDPLVNVLRALRSPHPQRDARSIHAIAWALVAERLAGGALTRDEAKDHVLRFCEPVIGATP